MSDSTPKNERGILVVDDEQSMREFLTIMLEKEGLSADAVSTGDEAIERIRQGDRFRLVITDLKMPGSSGIEVLTEVKAHDPACQVVVMTAYATPETAIDAIKSGAYDYLTKPFKLDQVKVVVERALEKFDLVSENLYLRKALRDQEAFPEIIGRSEVMQRVFDLVTRVAPTTTTVLLSGESGTGKELVARAIHEHGSLEGPFVPVNCGAIPENLIEAELFGYKKGAFTGAEQDKKGLFEAAEGGTIFLDEVGELPLNTQVRLLRVLQEKKVKPVGGTEELPVDCRIVAATNRDLREDVEEGRFREDLYYRLNVIQIDIPPLRKRGSDLTTLIEFFIEHFAEKIGNPIEGIEADALEVLMNHHYPGNVRELQNIIERAVTLERTNMITVDALPTHIVENRFKRAADQVEFPEDGINLEAIVEQMERQLISEALERADGVKTEAARLLGISFRAFRYRLQKYEME